MYYDDDPVYQQVERLIESAGVEVWYKDAAKRATRTENRIIMPDSTYPDAKTACIVLGYQAGRVISGEVDKIDDPERDFEVDAICSIFATYLYKLAKRIYRHGQEPEETEPRIRVFIDDEPQKEG